MLSLSDRLEPDATSPRSQASFAYEIIRGEILSGRHRPDKKLKIQDLAVELSVSPGAVREALSRMVPEQLVVSRDQRGFVVASLSIADLVDLTDLRCEIEAIALRRSVALGDVDWEVGILAAAHRLRAAQMRMPDEATRLNPQWITAHAAYHYSLVAACGSKRLLAFHSQLYEQSERYRGLTAHLESNRNVSDEHHKIVELALARNVDALVHETIDHLRATTSLIINAANIDGGQAA